ncbi:energy transducer TonB [Marinicauda algicola]|uniref:Protein TonB n=1 Tax=Marinicauda algicola TaxID=2029849 RepID=A0A4S2GZ83_9PROT|nr:energy transducer TonB [Marinicauda algicola]TGY88517.1 energy transducer TonB [Marinicauda algicola]
MASIIRLIVGIPIAGIVTFLLFVLMDILISGGDFTPEEEGEDLRISISEEVEEVEARRRETQIDEVEEVIPPPPPPQIERERADQPNESMETVVGDLPEFEAPDLAGDQVSFDVSDRDAQPLVRIPPQYPPRAAERGLSGHCDMRFDVTPDGTPTNISAVNCTSSIFERTSVRAIERWRYEPKIQEGNAVWRRGVQTRIDYQLEEG